MIWTSAGKEEPIPANEPFLTETVALLNDARAFYIDFFLAHADKLAERVSSYSEKYQQMRERAISAHELLTWAEFHTVATKETPLPWRSWNFSERFPDLPFPLSALGHQRCDRQGQSLSLQPATWQQTGKKKGKPGLPGASNHPMLYAGELALELDQVVTRESFVRLKVYTGDRWMRANYPVKDSRFFEQRRARSHVGTAKPEAGPALPFCGTALLSNERGQSQKSQGEQA